MEQNVPRLHERGPFLTAAPNPSRGSIAFTSSWRTSGAGSLTVRDVQRRFMRVLSLAGHQAAWDGHTNSGEAAHNGIYFATLHAGGHTTTIRFSLIR